MAKWEAQLLQPLCVTNHFDYMRTHCSAFGQLALDKGLGYGEPFSPGLSLKHVLKRHDHIVCLMVCLELHLYVRFHASEHKAACFKVVVTSLSVSSLFLSRCIISRLFW